MVKIVADTSKIEDKDQEFFSDKNFDIICALVNDINYLTKLNDICRKNNVMFLSGFVFGLYGQMFVDFNDYKYIMFVYIRFFILVCYITLIFYIFREATKIIEESADKKTASSAAQICSISQKATDKSSFEEKNIQFKSFQDYLNDYEKYFQSITPNKLKRLSKIFILNFCNFSCFITFILHSLKLNKISVIVVNKFNQTHSKQFDPSSSEDINNMITLKNEELQRLKLNTEVLDDSFLSK